MHGRIKSASIFFCLLLLGAALLSGFLFDLALDDRAYVQMRFAQNWFAGHGFVSDPAVIGTLAPWPSPMFGAFLTGANLLGVDLEAAALFANSLGFALLAILLHIIGVTYQRPFTSWFLPMILAWGPSVFFDLLLAQIDSPLAGLSWFLLSFPVRGWAAFLVLILVGFLIDYGIDLRIKDDELELGQTQIVRLIGLLIVVPVIVLQIYLMTQANQPPVAYAQAEEEVAVWLSEHSQKEAVIWGSPRLGYLANRPVLYTRSFALIDELPAFLAGVMVQSPDYFITDGSLLWDYITRTGWFENNYQLEKKINFSADSRESLILWSRKSIVQSFDRSLEPTLLTNEGLHFVRGEVSANQIQPGDSLNVLIEWSVDRPPTSTMQTIVRLESPQNQSVWAQQDLPMPRSLPSDWLRPGMVFPESFVLATNDEIPVGGYRVSASLYQPPSGELAAMYKPGEDVILDRATLGFVAVPWVGSIPDNAASIEAVFNNQIKLLSCACPAEATVGQLIPLTLFWTATNPIDANYVAFVHFLDASGQYVTGSDAQPYGGGYDMRAWLPEHIIPDERAISIPADLLSGEYSLQVGLYNPADGNRLPAVNRVGSETPNQTITLPSIQIVPEQ